MFKSKFIIYLMDISFNILDCFDDNINNLDITKYYIYVLKLVDDRYYVGRTGNILHLCTFKTPILKHIMI